MRNGETPEQNGKHGSDAVPLRDAVLCRCKRRIRCYSSHRLPPRPSHSIFVRQPSLWTLDLLPNANLELRWHDLGIDGGFKPGAQPHAGTDFSGTSRAALDMSQNLGVSLDRELVADEGVEVLSNFLPAALSKLNPIHGLFPS